MLGKDFRALEIGPRRVFEYESVYFDTPELEQFRAHRQGRRRRYKVRTRTYVDSGLCMFEVKFKGQRGQTVKHRMPYQLQDSFRTAPG
ncbi:VTC domain-containing protein [Arthrobacter terrae]|uniref:VTC domain-containing protein n=1 Tax=Arthrobacter terrae TaxID=2935737 RepID=UPI001E2CE32D